MLILFRYSVNLTKIGNYGIGKNRFLKNLNYSVLKFYSQKATRNAEDDKCVSFMDMIQQRRKQASKSILVQVQSAQSFKDLYSYCNYFGEVKEMFHYSEGPEKMHCIIVEFASESDINNILTASTHIMDHQTVPVNSQFLWFRAANRKFGKLKQNKNATLSVENGTNIPIEEDLKVSLKQCETISGQIQQVYNLTKLNEVGRRLRFLTAKQVESTVCGLFPNVVAYPFGSSVNGFGKMGCDLDLVLRLAKQKENEKSRLIYHCKAVSGSERTTNQRNIEAIGDLINLFLPGCTHVRRILQARVPIIKYHQQFTNIECDLSMTNMSGVYMSDFLYIMGELDKRVRPLVFTIRKWAKEVGLTNASPGKWISNFSLTLLALAFLQKPLYSPPVLPTLNALAKLAGPNDQYITEDGIDCTFLRDINKINFKSENNSSLEALLLGFFEFYSLFDFNSKALCLNESVTISKPEHNAMYIVNPLERGLNVSKNVSFEEVVRFKTEVRNAAWRLESQEHRSENGGLLSIFESKNITRNKLNFTFSEKNDRLMEISTIFNEDDTDTKENEEIVFKNKAVQKEIASIRKKTKGNIKSMALAQAAEKSQR